MNARQRRLHRRAIRRWMIDLQNGLIKTHDVPIVRQHDPELERILEKAYTKAVLEGSVVVQQAPAIYIPMNITRDGVTFNNG